MEYIENTFKMRKETKHNTVLRKAKEPKGRKPTTEPNHGLVMCRKEPKPKPNCNTPGVSHLISSGFEFKHDRLRGNLVSGDKGVEVKSMKWSPNLNLDNTPLLTCGS